MFSKMKRNARLAMSKSWGTATTIILTAIAVEIIISLFVILTNYAVSGNISAYHSSAAINTLQTLSEYVYRTLVIQLVRVISAVFLITPFSLGIASWYMAVVNGTPERFSGVFVFYESHGRYWRSVWYFISMSIRTTFWAVLFFLVPFGIIGGTIALTQSFAINNNPRFAVLSAMGMILAILLASLTLFLYLAYMNKYFLVPYLLATDTNISVNQAVKRSIVLTREHRFSILYYALSFIGWFLLTLVCLPFLFYTVPYASTSFAMYAQYLIESARHNEQPQNEAYTREFSPEDQIPTEDTPAFPSAAPPDFTKREGEIISPDTIGSPNNPENHIPGGDNPQEQPSETNNGRWPYL